MIEAELKADVREPERVRQALAGISDERIALYRDTYYDWPTGSLHAGEQEIRVRTETSGAMTRHLLTFKSAAVDAQSRSKPEMETEAASRSAADGILRGLGLQPFVSFEKHCSDFSLMVEGRTVLATLVRVPELDGTFLEVETMVGHQRDLVPALDAVRRFMFGLGITAADLTTATYTDGVLSKRNPAAPSTVVEL